MSEVCAGDCDQVEQLSDALAELHRRVRLLRELYLFVWNELEETDEGDHVSISWEHSQRMSDICARIEDFEVELRGGVTEDIL